MSEVARDASVFDRGRKIEVDEDDGAAGEEESEGEEKAGCDGDNFDDVSDA